MKNFFLILRTLLGIAFLLYGLNGFLGIIPKFGLSADFSISQENLISSLKETSFFIPMLNITQILLGSLLVMNFLTPLTLIILLPITINVFLFHFYLGANKTFFNKEMFIPITLGISHVILIIHNLPAYLKISGGKSEAKKDDNLEGN